MPLKLRRTGLGSGVDKDRPDYTIYSGEWQVGRIYQTRGDHDSLRWCWSMAGALIIGLQHASTARSHSRSGSRSPALAKPMIALAIASRGGSTTPQLCRAWMANSNA